jgi:hypothetical protein
MDDTIIGITAKRQQRIVPLHPGVEHIVEKEVSQDRAYHPPLSPVKRYPK